MPNTPEVFRNYGFFLELQGERAGYFTRISGLGLKVESIEYREGGMPSTVRKLPGRTHINDVVLSFGASRSDVLWRWLDSAVQGRDERKNVSIVVLAPDGQSEVARWNPTNSPSCTADRTTAKTMPVRVTTRRTRSCSRLRRARAAMGFTPIIDVTLLISVPEKCRPSGPAVSSTRRPPRADVAWEPGVCHPGGDASSPPITSSSVSPSTPQTAVPRRARIAASSGASSAWAVSMSAARAVRAAQRGG